MASALLVDGQRKRGRGRGGDDGVAIIEFTVVVTLFVIIVFNIVSFGPFFNVYLTTAHLTHEGARMLSSRSDLTPDVRVTSVWQLGGTSPTVCHRDQGGSGFPDCDGTVGTIPDSHREIHDRVLMLINAINLARVFTNDRVGVVTTYDSLSDSVQCTIYGQYQGWAGLLLGTVVVTEEGPFLY